MKNKKILIIDDDPEILSALATILEIYGYSIDTATNTKDGLVKFTENRPDLVILDIMMETKTEGLEFASNLKAKEGLFGIPILIVSGDFSSPSFEETFERSVNRDMDWIPADIYMEKPVDPEGFVHNVKILLGDN